ncbi:MAG: methyltransferase, partial [Cyanothece sp. SIO2G6]|nr:methyltransferase [Cyanothece sp. SIO2G6]
NPVWFLDLVKRTIRSNHNAIVFFEVPNARLILDDFSPWDVIYEHCSYFSVESLRTAFERAGFTVLRTEETYRGQFITIEAKLSAEGVQQAEQAVEELGKSIQAFAKDLKGFLARWQSLVDGWHEAGKKVAVWGAGAKAVGFLNMLGRVEFIEHVVDINPHKHGKYLAGTGQKVISPEALVEVGVDVLLLMNPIYGEEVSAQIKELGIEAELVTAI